MHIYHTNFINYLSGMIYILLFSQKTRDLLLSQQLLTYCLLEAAVFHLYSTSLWNSLSKAQTQQNGPTNISPSQEAPYV